MGLYRRGTVWWIKLKCQGKTIRRSTDTTNITLARRIEQKLLYELASGKWFETNPADEILFSEAWERYLREDAKFKSKSTYSRALQVGKLIIPFLKDLKLSEVTPSILCSYRAHRLGLGLKPNTVAKELHFVRRVFSLCKREWQVIKQSPFEFFTMPSEDDRRVRYLEPGEIDTLLFHSPAWLKPMLVLARNTGMRRGNILGLTWSEVNMQERVINLERTKNGQRLTIPLNNAAYDVLDGLKNAKVKLLHCSNVFHMDGKPFDPYRVSMAFKRACRRAGIENFRFHDLRHDFASKLVQNGNDLYVVQHLLGHKDGRMTQRYAHLKLDNMRAAVSTLEEETGRGHKKGHSQNEKGSASALTP